MSNIPAHAWSFLNNNIGIRKSPTYPGLYVNVDWKYLIKINFVCVLHEIAFKFILFMQTVFLFIELVIGPLASEGRVL